MVSDLSGFSKRKVEVVKNQIVCCHLYDDVTNGRTVDPKPFCIDFIMDGYYLYWYCDKCQKLYGLPKKGVYLYDEANLDVVINKLTGFTVSSNPENNPFKKFCDEQTSKYVSETVFLSLAGFLKDDIHSIVNHAMRVPFGCVKEAN